MAVEKGTKAVILLNLSVFGERTQLYKRNFWRKCLEKSFSTPTAISLTRRPSWKRDFSPELPRGLGMQVGASTTASQFRSHLGPTISRCADRCEQALKSSSELRQTQSEYHPLTQISTPVSISKAQRRGSLVEVSLMKNMLVTTLFMLATLAWRWHNSPAVPRSGAVGRPLPRVRRCRVRINPNHRRPAARIRPGRRTSRQTRLSPRAAWGAAIRTSRSRTELTLPTSSIFLRTPIHQG